MPATVRIAIAMLCATLAAPATATQYWDFTFTASIPDNTTIGGANIGGQYTLSGQTAAGVSGTGSLSGTITSVTGPSGGTNFQTFDDYRVRPETEGYTSDNSHNLDFSESGAVTWAAGRDNLYVFSFDFMSGSEPQTVYFAAGNAGDHSNWQEPGLIWTDDTHRNNPDFHLNNNIPVSLSGSAANVPEINGSGFAYIAFILGALGLWLYSGGGIWRRESTRATG